MKSSNDGIFEKSDGMPMRLSISNKVILLLLSSLLALISSIFLSQRANRTNARFRCIDRQRQLNPLNFFRANETVEFAANGPQQVRDAYVADKSVPVYIKSINRLVLPPYALRELSRLPAEVASLRSNFVDRYAGRWTGFDLILETGLFSDVVRVGLTQDLNNLLPYLREKARSGLDQHLDQPCSSNTVPIFDLVLEVTLRMTAFTLVGEPICEDPAFLAILKAYPTQIDVVSKQFNSYPLVVHPLLALVSRHLRQLRKMQTAMVETLTPIVREVQHNAAEAAEADEGSTSPGKAKETHESGPFNVLRALARRSSGSASSPNKISLQLMFLSLAALFVSAVATTQVVLQIVAKRHWVPQLREELVYYTNAQKMEKPASESTGAYGDVECSKLSLKDLRTMPKLNAFIKETIRMDMPGWSSVMRKMIQPHTFNATPLPSNPIESNKSEPIPVPAQTMVCIPTAAMSRDPEYFPNPDTFDPTRFYPRNTAPKPTPPSAQGSNPYPDKVSEGQAEKSSSNKEAQEPENENHFAALDPRMPVWGVGRWSCPGRFYADLQIKLIVTEILMNWDVSLPGGMDGASADGVTAIKRINTGDRIIPDPKQEVIFKRRRND